MQKIKPAKWGPINIRHTPQLTVLCCARVKRLPAWHARNVQGVYWRLYWNNRAGALLRAPDGAPYPLHPDTFTLVAPNTLLSQELTRPVEHYFTHFTIGLPFARVQNRVLQFNALPFMVDIMRRNYPEHGADAPHAAHCMTAAAQLCWHALAALPPDWLPADDGHPRLRELLQWWESMEWRMLPNHALAERIRMNPSAFCRYFHREMGAPPHTYGLNKRIERACLLLHYSRYSIEQIAEITGFCDRYYFSAAFRKMRGSSPAAFRRQAVTMLS